MYLRLLIGSIPDVTWWVTWWYLAKPLQYILIQNNSCLFQRPPDKLGINNKLSIAANTISVLTWYRHNMILTIFCLPGIVMVPNLAIFRKPLKCWLKGHKFTDFMVVNSTKSLKFFNTQVTYPNLLFQV